MPRRLAKEMIEHDRDFERDPQLRDQYAVIGIEGSEVVQSRGTPTPASPVAAAPPPAPKPSASNKVSLADIATSPSQLAMAAWTTLIVVLAIIATILLLTKK
jgi:hypothetical protein